MRDSLPADQRSKRDPEKKRAVVPGENRGAMRRKVVGEAGLLSWEK